MFPFSQNPFAPPDESYVSNASFEETVDLLRSIATSGTHTYSLDENILVIETPDGVFIRARDPEWVDFLSNLAKDPIEGLTTLKAISPREWTNMTTRYRAPVQSFGDNLLARWKVGF